MSALLHVKGIILTHMSATPELKEAVMDVIDGVDSDLDQFEDIISEQTDEAIERLNNVLIGKDEEEEEEVERDEIIKRENLLDDTDEEESELP